MNVPYALCGLSERYRDGRLIVDFTTKTAYLDRNGLDLTRKEYQLLAELARNVGKPVSRAALLASVWGYDAAARSRTVDEHVRRLRSKLGTYGRDSIKTISGVGYKLEPQHSAGQNDLGPDLPRGCGESCDPDST